MKLIKISLQVILAGKYERRILPIHPLRLTLLIINKRKPFTFIADKLSVPLHGTIVVALYRVQECFFIGERHTLWHTFGNYLIDNNNIKKQ